MEEAAGRATGRSAPPPRLSTSSQVGCARFVSHAGPERIVILSSDFFGCVLAPVCYRMAREAIEVRRGVYILLVVFLVQLSGLRTLCVPSHCSSHPCCPMSTNTTPPSSSSLPACCLNFLLNYQGSITETQNAGHPSEYTGQLGEISHPSAVPLVSTSAPVRQHILPSISPPLSPLSQSCLLLI
jgi:hypothetical protein